MGKHKIHWKYVDEKKSFEGSTAMFVASFLTVAVILMIRGALPAIGYIIIPGLVIALLGIVANTLFWRKYTRLNKAEPNPILSVQARLYCAKSLVDCCVVIALISVMILPGYDFSHYLDMVGSIIVAVYLILCGIQTIREKLT